MKASRILRFEKLPNILIINLKRFLWVPRSNRLIKKKEHIYFEDTLEIDAGLVSPNVQVGMFGERSRKYRLFSVVEHLGKDAGRGHYVNYSLDAQNVWQKFDDSKLFEIDYKSITENAQAYMLFYELMLDE